MAESADESSALEASRETRAAVVQSRSCTTSGVRASAPAPARGGGGCFARTPSGNEAPTAGAFFGVRLHPLATPKVGISNIETTTIARFMAHA
jgi:hypothetical protein